MKKLQRGINVSDVEKKCDMCESVFPVKAFRSGSKQCVWCQYQKMEKRAINRFRDKVKMNRIGKHAFKIDKDSFVAWYCSQKDLCHYCGVTFDELRRLRLKGRAGYYVSWDIDRVQSESPYEIGNIVLSCMVCNTAKSNYLTESEAKEVGKTIKSIFNKRLKNGS